MSSTVDGSGGPARCRWAQAAPDFYRAYHDTEWGFPVADDHRLFEKLSLEGFQSGLSWRTILAKRENFRAAFHNFDFRRIARFTRRDVDRLLKDPGIVRHREGSLAAFIWRFEPTGAAASRPQTVSESAESRALSKALKDQGWKFVGPTTVYAFMQAMGLVNDHEELCDIRSRVEKARRSFRRPGA
jgi:DNA-3-methyladenine glycosylase I